MGRRYVAVATAEPSLSQPPPPQQEMPEEPQFTETVFTGLRKPVKPKPVVEEPEGETDSEPGLDPLEALELKRARLRRSVEKLQEDLRARKNAKDRLGIADTQQVTKAETTVFDMPFGKLQALNAVFSFAAFPIHIWGYSLNIDPFLLVFPFSFSVLWLAYSHKKATRTIKHIRALEGHKQLELTPYSFFGTTGKPFVVDKSDVHVVLDMPKVDRDKRNHIDVALETALPGIKKKRRYVIEREQGVRPDQRLWKVLFVF
jgi:hypothetical protein